MTFRWTCAALLAAALFMPSAAFAGADDYHFELVPGEMRAGSQAVVAVRLMHKPSGKPVPDAVLFRSRLDMSPDNMAGMTAALVPAPGGEPGVHAFRAELSMAGRWLLRVAAKVQGEAQTVVGKIIVQVAE